MAPSPGYALRLLVNVISFLPALALMTIPIFGAAWLTGRWPTLTDVWSVASATQGVLALVTFMIYVVCCAASNWCARGAR